MPVGSQPHSSWANVYDLAYEHSFGNFYSQITDTIISVITDRIKTPASIVDFGAGTGRLSIPLAKKGFDVVAVEPCKEMLAQLNKKQKKFAVRTVCSKMEYFECSDRFNVALCVFTVLIYLLDEESLKKALSTAFASLKPNGILIIDIPSRAIFRGYYHSDNTLERAVSVTQEDKDIFNYQESIKLKDGNGSEYIDQFLIRYWSEKTVKGILNDIGFIFEENLSNDFSGTGANYYILKKTE